jgi:hypothetical protein
MSTLRELPRHGRSQYSEVQSWLAFQTVSSLPERSLQLQRWHWHASHDLLVHCIKSLLHLQILHQHQDLVRLHSRRLERNPIRTLENDYQRMSRRRSRKHRFGAFPAKLRRTSMISRFTLSTVPLLFREYSAVE